MLRVGYFDSERDRYEDGTSVATVAALHEFGLASGSVRPKSFIAKAFPSMLKIVHEEIRLGKATHESGVSIALARRMGERAAQALNESVITHELVDTGLLSRSATYTIDDPPLTSEERPTRGAPVVPTGSGGAVRCAGQNSASRNTGGVLQRYQRFGVRYAG